ncbi:adenosylcobalamin-dependent ribonucleoside-triphosphate reductase [Streptomyces xanthochromogenes]|uniref:hypothetical protein n=1 Tax=Streptomyces xanthochromogenes TaxID=67384 RepID=UPI001676E68C|nr:hypothetical protein [Streptomyces xanthochromogenes]GHB52637.1 adenosylcobalamin-dependent ribonucleoside-triphosphate reductase [Streptomyces xanthochromogenes]
MTLIDSLGDLTDPYQAYITKSRYARWRDDLGRRETWTETVDRYFAFMTTHLQERCNYVPDKALARELRHAVLHHEVLPSMRALMTAGVPLDLSHVAGYNCAYTPLDDLRSFSEVLFILLNGTGVGFSVESRYVDQLPVVAHQRSDPATRIVVADSKLGWAEAFDLLLDLVWIDGRIPEVDYSLVRPAGARLATFGGRASGPEPLKALFDYTVELLRSAQGRKLRPIEAHDLACKVADVVVVGGVRRSAMISLSDLDDREMATAKSGEWWVEHPYRALANNSAVYHDGMRYEEFRAEWDVLVASGSGERGIFHRDAAQRQAAKFGRREQDVDYGTNPCSEIILRPRSFCNLSTIVVRPQDGIGDLRRKITLAAILGTWQATLTDFPFLREEWSANAREERLLGVSMTGIFNSALLTDGQGRDLKNDVLERLRDEAREANELEAELLGISPSRAITAIKPEGTTSQKTGVPSGLHPSHAPYWVRTVRNDVKDPISNFLIDSGVPHEKDLMNDQNWVFSFPQRAAADAVTREDLTAIQHLELWLDFQRHYCEHKPSVTVSVRESEWDEVREWVWAHLDEMSGVSFLPYSEHTYVQAPYQECDEATYRELAAKMPTLLWSDLFFYEKSDHTTGTQEYACSADGCDVK